MNGRAGAGRPAAGDNPVIIEVFIHEVRPQLSLTALEYQLQLGFADSEVPTKVGTLTPLVQVLRFLSPAVR